MHTPSDSRYDCPDDWFRSCGNSGLKLPAVSLGCWHNFGGHEHSSAGCSDETEQHRNAQKMLFTAFDCGITHFDFANNYGPPPGSAESRAGRIFEQDLSGYRDELIISSKAGYDMWKGPYGDGGSRKYLIASCEQSLKRLRLDYVDIFYHHRPDPDTPVAESMGALDFLVRSGKALYSGISNYPPEKVAEALEVCEANGWTKPIIHQPRYNLLDRHVEEQGLFDTLNRTGMGSICFSPLQGGLLTGKYLDEDPVDSRRHAGSGRIGGKWFEPENAAKLRELRAIAENEGLSLTTFSLAWAIRKGACTSALIGASRPAQIQEASALLDNGPLSDTAVEKAEGILNGSS